METCIICRYENAKRYITKQSDKVEEWKYECDMCGKYIVSDDIKFEILKLVQKENPNIYKLQGWIREKNDEMNVTPEIINKEDLEKILLMRNKTIQEQFEYLMLNMYKASFEKNRKLEEVSEFEYKIIKIKSFIKRDSIFVKLVEKSINDNFIKGNLIENGFVLDDFIFDGLQYVESLQYQNKNSNKIFLAFKFRENKKTFEEIKRFIENDIEDIKFQAVIVNQDTTEHNEKISDKIIAELKGARMIVADFSAHSPNVYFEAGYAMGMNIPVIWTCHTEHLKGMAFDVNHFPVIGWENINDLKEKLRDRILRLI